MAKTNEVTLGAAIRSMISELNLRHGIYGAKIEAMWEPLMGKTIARHTTAIHLKGNRLYLTVDSAALRTELFYSRAQIKELVNKEIGEDIVADVFIY